MAYERDDRIFRLFYSAHGTQQPCVPATEHAIPRVAKQHLHTERDRQRFNRFVITAMPGDVFHLTGKVDKIGREGVVIVCQARKQLRKGEIPVTYDPLPIPKDSPIWNR